MPQRSRPQVSPEPMSDEEDEEPVPASQATTIGSSATVFFPSRGFGSFASSSSFSGKFAPSTARTNSVTFNQGHSAFGSLPRSQTVPAIPSPSNALNLGLSDRLREPSARDNAGARDGRAGESSHPTRSPSPVEQNAMAGESTESQVSTVLCSSENRSVTPGSVTGPRSPRTTISSDQIVSAYTLQASHPYPTSTSSSTVAPRAPLSEQAKSLPESQPMSLHNFFPTPMQYPSESRLRPMKAYQLLNTHPVSNPQHPERPPSALPAHTAEVPPQPNDTYQQPKTKRGGRKRPEWKVDGYNNNSRSSEPPIASLARQPALSTERGTEKISSLHTSHYKVNGHSTSTRQATPEQRCAQGLPYAANHSQRPCRTIAETRQPSAPAPVPAMDFSLFDTVDDSATTPDEGGQRLDYGSTSTDTAPSSSQHTIRARQPCVSKLPGSDGASTMPAAGATSAGELHTVQIIIEDERNGEDIFIEDDFALENGPSGIQRLDIRRLADALQSGPSRRDGECSVQVIDAARSLAAEGPAKVYTLRNGRKQFIVDVSEDNVDKIGSGKVQVPSDLTITLHVEYVGTL